MRGPRSLGFCGFPRLGAGIGTDFEQYPIDVCDVECLIADTP
jgi:hypothetical protein